MGLSASQARFLQLTARKSNVEYQAQQINFERLQWADKLTAASSEYTDKTSNRKMVFSFNNGDGTMQVDVTYNNYKNYMNQQLDGLTTSQDKMYLVSSSGNKIVVASEAERDAMIEANTTYTPISSSTTIGESDGTTTVTMTDDDGNSVQYLANRTFNESDFLIVDGLDDEDNFQDALQNGVYFFATLGVNSETGETKLNSQSWETIGGGAISEVYDTSDDAQAEAEFEEYQSKVQTIDKKLELQLNQLETEREAIQTEIDSVSKVIEDNIESSFTAFS